MRYIIIPLAIILYLIWSYKSIKNLIKDFYYYFNYDFSTVFWSILHMTLIFMIIIELSFRYW